MDDFYLCVLMLFQRIYAVCGAGANSAFGLACAIVCRSIDLKYIIF